MTGKGQNTEIEPENIRAVILDYHRVLCRSPREDYVERMVAPFGIDRHTFWRLYEQNRTSFHKGELTPAAYWKSVAHDAGTKVDAFTIERLAKLDVDMWATLEEPLLEWVARLRASGYKTALLSNAHPHFAAHLRQNGPWLRVFEVCVFSSEVQLVKPAPKIFRLALEKLETKIPGSVLLIDSHVSNVSVARSLGIHAIKFTSVVELNRELKDLGFPHLVRI
jgi:putative hydrolase of the HAD superfamily